MQLMFVCLFYKLKSLFPFLRPIHSPSLALSPHLKSTVPTKRTHVFWGGWNVRIVFFFLNETHREMKEKERAFQRVQTLTDSVRELWLCACYQIARQLKTKWQTKDERESKEKNKKKNTFENGFGVAIIFSPIVPVFTAWERICTTPQKVFHHFCWDADWDWSFIVNYWHRLTVLSLSIEYFLQGDGFYYRFSSSSSSVHSQQSGLFHPPLSARSMFVAFFFSVSLCRRYGGDVSFDTLHHGQQTSRQQWKPHSIRSSFPLTFWESFVWGLSCSFSYRYLYGSSSGLVCVCCAIFTFHFEFNYDQPTHTNTPDKTCQTFFGSIV